MFSQVHTNLLKKIISLDLSNTEKSEQNVAETV